MAVQVKIARYVEPKVYDFNTAVETQEEVNISSATFGLNNVKINDHIVVRYGKTLYVFGVTQIKRYSSIAMLPDADMWLDQTALSKAIVGDFYVCKVLEPVLNTNTTGVHSTARTLTLDPELTKAIEILYTI